MTTVWCGYYDGNTKSRRVMEKCGFSYHHTEYGKMSPLGDIRTEHFMRMTKEEWINNTANADIALSLQSDSDKARNKKQ